MSLQTQWRSGPSGPIGLDYNILYRKIDRMDASAEDLDRLEADIQIMEMAALDEIYSQRES